MKVWTIIFLLITSLVGFFLSYEIAYKKVINLMREAGDQTQIASRSTR